ncbi:sensor histidine kinase [Salegentibacter salegens]|uniref:histidine kinase n=1 Tax=Salegentibacter salegens TaxID=143223 RepID=A0A1M7KR94_9FLAO|nr:HAMP domain-containing sensor histidine kinase [Salegentibacter salegens]PRX48838.1 signal transduction histidine kinase [Salegentibacter salegens]SHM67960.1 Signal transduction histidine kinase [Salegentibacter salegens]
MKLLNYTTSYFAAILLVLLGIWAVIFYLEMLDEIYDSLDDGLDNQKMLVINRAKENPEVLQRSEFKDGSYTIRPIDKNNAVSFKDFYRDTLMYMQNEDEYEPVRLLETVFKKDDEFYKLKIITSMVEEDDLIEDLLFSLILLYVGLILSIVLLNNLILKKIWNPFYTLLQQLKDFRLGIDQKIETAPSNIEEFNLLNSRVEQMLGKSISSYNSQKQFIENAAHELQTPLAISINKLELLVEKEDLNNEQIELIASVLNNLEGLTRMNNALLLLSKIENQQFPDEEIVDFNDLISELKNNFEDLASHKEMKISIERTSDLKYKMNKGLAGILLSNLLKNAIVHGQKNSEIGIIISAKNFTISNIARNGALDPENVFSRFQKNSPSKTSTGIGLAIAKTIAEKCEIQLTYQYEQKHTFQLNFLAKLLFIS